ncbi:hypothetical protein OsJ_04606 [Oryza sativa Japonica Group]|uniref:Uncharacterized protein n=2 Tax=Oryza TaxID=4527 RepID=B9EVZ1_ORYSJ|nr:hypothetical protein OsJ_04606 [Oryza sativa Japonica Group]
MAGSGGGDRGSPEAELRRGFKTLAVTRPDPSAAVYEVRLNRPTRLNALSPDAFAEIPRAMALLDRAPAARAVNILSSFRIDNEMNQISEKSAWAVMGTKAVLLRSRDITVEQGLEHVATWNAAMLRSNDLEEAIQAFLEKRKPVFSKL